MFQDRLFSYFHLRLIIFLLTGTAVLANDYDEVPHVAPGVRAPIDSLFHIPLSRGLEFVYNDRFEDAVALFDSLIAAGPDHPAAYFYKAATLQTWMSTYRFNRYEKDLESNVELAIEKGDHLLELGQKNPWLNFYVGGAYGYRAFFKMRSWNWIGAYRDGMKGISNLKKSLDQDATLYDAYLGLGSYHYWRSARSKFIRIVVFWMSDKRKEGLAQIDFSIAHGRYCGDESSLVLVTALYDNQEYDKALEVLDSFSSLRKTHALSELYLRGRILQAFEKWGEVRGLFESVLARLNEKPYSAIGYKVECKYWIAETYFKENRPEQALALVNEALDQSEARNKDVELEGQFSNFDEIKDDLQDLKKELEKQ